MSHKFDRKLKKCNRRSMFEHLTNRFVAAVRGMAEAVGK